jgi:hypothetical protein
MNSRIARLLMACATTSMLAACGPSIYSLRVPLNDTATLTTAGAAVTIDDQRPEAERKVHTGGGLFRCMRYYGDETYVPAKVEYLRQLLQARVPAGRTLHVRLDRLDTIEYCDNTANRGAAAAAAGTGAPYIVPADIPGGDSVLIQATGEVDGKPFDVKRGFDYSALPVPFPQMPAYNTEYVVRFKRAFDEIADEIVAGGSFRP